MSGKQWVQALLATRVSTLTFSAFRFALLSRVGLDIIIFHFLETRPSGICDNSLPDFNYPCRPNKLSALSNYEQFLT